ncbi:MAG: hypothetical protein K6G88_11865 [Lachnospiraceae bacterium]|nr:hypothetical protein [Lachnospiraceae bacterium]
MINIYSKADYPGNELSNFARHPFELDGVKIASMEGFLQALKYRNEENQKLVCSLSGEEAKRAGKYKFMWKMTQFLHWQGRDYELFSDNLQILIDRAYEAMYEQSEEFRKALVATGSEVLTYEIGIQQMDKTVLTEYHFVRRLEKLRIRALSEIEKQEEGDEYEGKTEK